MVIDAKNQKSTFIDPALTPGPAFLEAFTGRARARRHPVDASVRTLVALFLEGEDRDKVRACRRGVVRLRHAAHMDDKLTTSACRSLWCPWCAEEAHRDRTRFQARRIASLVPGRPRGADYGGNAPAGPLRLVNAVFTLPPDLRPLVREPGGVEAFRVAVWRTIYGAYGLGNDKYAARALGAIMNLHAWGDESWGPAGPIFAPHLDVLIPGARVGPDGPALLRTTWPEGFDTTRSRYRAELRRAFFELKPRLDLLARLDGDEWPVNLRIGKMVEGGRALHRVRYSCRPMFHMGRARVERASDDTWRLLYTPHGARGPNVCDAAAAFRTFYALRTYIGGTSRRSGRHVKPAEKRPDFVGPIDPRWPTTAQRDGSKVHAYFGITSRKAYERTVTSLGRDVVAWREPTGWRITDRARPVRPGEYEWFKVAAEGAEDA